MRNKQSKNKFQENWIMCDHIQHCYLGMNEDKNLDNLVSFLIISIISIIVSISQTDGRIPGGTPADLQLSGRDARQK